MATSSGCLCNIRIPFPSLRLCVSATLRQIEKLCERRQLQSCWYAVYRRGLSQIGRLAPRESCRSKRPLAMLPARSKQRVDERGGAGGPQDDQRADQQ